MRVFLVLLILANLGYLAWRQEWLYDRPASPRYLEQGFRPAEQPLTRLIELPPERLELMSSLAEARAARTQAVEQLQDVQEQVAGVAGEIDENRAEVAQEQARSAEVQEELLDTLDAAVAEAPPELPPAPPWCANTSEFADQSAAAAFMSGLGGLGVEGEIELREQPISSTWWVHMPAFASEAEARDMLNELQGRGIDSYYMRTGDMAGGISLGVYSREESARIAQRQLEEQGYTTSIREVFRMEERASVRLRMPDGRVRESQEWADFMAAAEPVELTEFACEAIASENQFP